MDEFLLKLIQSLGVPGMTVFLLYKLLDRYFAKAMAEFAAFNQTSAKQAQSMESVATLSQGHREEQRDVAMALRVLSKQMETMSARVKEMDDRMVQPK